MPACPSQSLRSRSPSPPRRSNTSYGPARCGSLAGEAPASEAPAGEAPEAEALAAQFNLDPATIAQAAETAQLDGTGADGVADRLWRACRTASRPRLESLAQRLEPMATWDDLVLPPEPTALLRQITDQVRQRLRVYDDWGFRAKMNRGLGISALFAGESGTGKTMAAEVMANDLRLDLYRIDLSAVVSKYIGETEKNLRRLFDAAEDGGAILFFDEADALFGKRSEVKDSHDRYANIEINYLLQRMEAYRGLAILATNMKSALDPAFMRRLRFIVNFPFPAPGRAQAMWQKVFPPQAPVGRAVDHDQLARLNLTGGNIHNIALNAAFMAASQQPPLITMPLRAGSDPGARCASWTGRSMRIWTCDERSHVHIERLILDGLPLGPAAARTCRRRSRPSWRACWPRTAWPKAAWPRPGRRAAPCPTCRPRPSSCARARARPRSAGRSPAASTAASEGSHERPDPNPDRADNARQTQSPAASGLLQRQCACGNHTAAGGECAACKQKRQGALQRSPSSLAINRPGDRYEQEAERVAAAVISGGELPGRTLSSAPALRRDGPPSAPSPRDPSAEERRKYPGASLPDLGFNEPKNDQHVQQPSEKLETNEDRLGAAGERWADTCSGRRSWVKS